MNKKQISFLIVLITSGLLGLSQRSLRHLPVLSDSDSSNDIKVTIERAYDIEAEAAYTFDLSKLSTVFMNDPRFPVDWSTLKTVKEFTNNPTLESAGYLDYKIAFYSWRRDATLHAEAIYANAKAENRDLTDDEKKSLIDSQGRTAPARAQSPERTQPLTFLSVEIKDDIALVVLDDGPWTSELTLVLMDDTWYIAGIKGISFHP